MCTLSGVVAGGVNMYIHYVCTYICTFVCTCVRMVSAHARADNVHCTVSSWEERWEVSGGGGVGRTVQWYCSADVLPARPILTGDVYAHV